MILTGPSIHTALKRGDITIRPFDKSQLNPNSYNYHLGGSLVTLGASAKPLREIVLPSRGYILKPGTVYLGATLEQIGSSRYVTLLLGRSSIGRLGIFLNVTADLGHLGCRSHWTLELT
ncbi:MAG: deoxycytidine deaminase, partial [Candidatus Binatia bacterium]